MTEPIEPPRSGSAGSLWLAAPHRRWDPLETDLSVDVAIVGGGIVGSAVAALLAVEGKRVALLEARSLGCGATGNSTAKFTIAQAAQLEQLVDAIGLEGAQLVVDGDRAAMDVLRQRIDDGAIDGAKRVTHWLYASSDDGRVKLQREQELAAQLGLEMRWADEGEFPIEGAHALGLDDQLLITPTEVVDAFAAEAHEHGAAVHEHTRVTEIEAGDTFTVRTEDGSIVRAEHVVLATHVPTLDRSLVFAGCSYRRSHAIALRAGGDLDRFRDMYTGIDPDGLSLRPAQDSDGTPLLVFAGHGHDLDQAEDGTHVGSLADHARELVGGGELVRAWLTHDAFPSDHRPFVGEARGADRLYVATGFGGWGLVRGISAALTLTSLIARGHAAWHEPVDAKRAGAYVEPSTLKEGIKTAGTWIGPRLRALASSDDELDDAAIPPGEGRIVTRHRRVVAVTRDEEGVLRELSAACTHLGCHVDYDAERRCLQCPCHGSRFALDGSVLDGPAVRPLELIRQGEE